MAVALLALVVALGGTATAASVLIKRSSQVATGAINSGDLADDRGVSLRDLTPATRRALAAAATAGSTPGPAGPRGAQGPAGARGEPGPLGADGPRGARGEALAYAHVPEVIADNGRLPDGTSKGVNEIRPIAGPFGPAVCFDLEVPAVNAVATIDFVSVARTGDLQVIAVAMPSTPGGRLQLLEDCPEGLRDAAAYFSQSDEPFGYFIAFN